MPFPVALPRHDAAVDISQFAQIQIRLCVSFAGPSVVRRGSDEIVRPTRRFGRSAAVVCVLHIFFQIFVKRQRCLKFGFRVFNLPKTIVRHIRYRLIAPLTHRIQGIVFIRCQSEYAVRRGRRVAQPIIRRIFRIKNSPDFNRFFDCKIVVVEVQPRDFVNAVFLP